MGEVGDPELVEGEPGGGFKGPRQNIRLTHTSESERAMLAIVALLSIAPLHLARIHASMLIVVILVVATLIVATLIVATVLDRCEHQCNKAWGG